MDIDPELIARAVDILVAHFAVSSDSLAKEAGKSAWNQVRSFYSKLRGMLANNSAATRALDMLEADPKSEQKRDMAIQALLEELQANKKAAELLEPSVAELESIQITGSVKQQVNITGGSTGSITQISDVDGDITINSD